MWMRYTNKQKNTLMKTNKWIVLLLLVFCGCANDKLNIENSNNKIKSEDYRLSISPGACFPEVSDKYVYPVVPGMEEWQQLESIDDAYKLCQLPDNVLKSISTPGLIDALIHAPLFTSFYMLSSNSSALKWCGYYDLFNSAKELFLRKDAGDALVAYYNLTCFDCLESLTGKESDMPAEVYQSETYHRMMGLEILFTRQEILDKIESVKKREAVTALLTNYEYNPEYVNGIFPMAYLMFADKYEPIMQYSRDHTEQFKPILEGFLYSFDQVDLIVSFAKNFINNKK